jgi:rsbT co-antagonist protein RsbR
MLHFEAVKKHGMVFSKLCLSLHTTREYVKMGNDPEADKRLHEEIAQLHQRVTELEKVEHELRLTRLTLDHATDNCFWLDMQGHFLYVNQALCRNLQYTAEELLQINVAEVDPVLSQEDVVQMFLQLKEAGTAIFEASLLRKDGTSFPVEVSANYLEFEGQEYISIFSRDITQRQHEEQERLSLKQQVIDAQHAALRELSTPLIPISDTTVVMPLIGVIDTARAQQIMETLLEGVAYHQTDLAILDITGVQTIDTQVADALVRAARAVRLLGASVVLTGIQPQIAQTMIHLGVDLSEIVTYGSLQAGIAYALNQQHKNDHGYDHSTA